MNAWPELYENLLKYLCPAGNGVYTVHTAAERKSALQQKLYNASGDAVAKSWQEQLKSLPNTDAPLLLGISSDCGGGILRGANWGPLFVREKLYAQHETHVFDLGDVRVIPHLLLDKYLNQETLANCRQALFNDKNSTLAVSPLSITQAVVKHIHKQFPDKKLFSIGGDHSVSYPLVKEYLRAKQQQGKNVAIIHFDAHTDLLEQRLGIDICFGSWAYHIIDDLTSPDQLIQIGIRSTGKSKQHWESTYGIKQFWSKDVADQGPETIAQQILEHLKPKNVDELYVTFDIDAIDANYVSATGTPEPNGLQPEDALAILQSLANNYPITGADLMEVAPFLAAKESEPESTLTLAADLANFLIGSLKK